VVQVHRARELQREGCHLDEILPIHQREGLSLTGRERDRGTTFLSWTGTKYVRYRRNSLGHLAGKRNESRRGKPFGLFLEGAV